MLMRIVCFVIAVNLISHSAFYPSTDPTPWDFTWYYNALLIVITRDIVASVVLKAPCLAGRTLLCVVIWLHLHLKIVTAGF